MSELRSTTSAMGILRDALAKTPPPFTIRHRVKIGMHPSRDEITAAIDDHVYAVSGHGEIWVEGIEDAARAVLELVHGEEA